MEKENSSPRLTEKYALATFEALYLKYNAAVFSFAYYLTQDRVEAEDLFQDTWLRIAKNLPGKDKMGSIKAWIFSIISNLHKDSLRKKRVRRLFLFKASSPLPSEEADRSSLGKDLSQAIAKLPARQRLVFVLKEISGFKQAEIGDILGIPLGTVKSLTHRAVKRLQRELVEYRPNSMDVRESNAL